MRKHLKWPADWLIIIGAVASLCLALVLIAHAFGAVTSDSSQVALMALSLVVAGFTCYMGAAVRSNMDVGFAANRAPLVLGLAGVMVGQFLLTFVTWPTFDELVRSEFNVAVHYGYNWGTILLAAITTGVVLGVDGPAPSKQ